MTYFQTIITKVRSRLMLYPWQLKCWLLPNNIASFRLIDGSKFNYPLKSTIGRILFAGNFEKAEIQYIIESLNPGDTFLDIGANGGIFTVIAANKVGVKGHVYAFEPGLRELEILRRNIEINNLKNVTVIESAVGDATGKTRFAISQDGAMNSLAENSHPGQKIESWQEVQITTLDDFLKSAEINRVDFIKIDVEGAEKLVIEGATNLLCSQDKLTILFEASDYNSLAFGYSTKDLITKIQSKGFQVKYFSEQHKWEEVSLENERLGKEVYNFLAIRP
jgi:FkbM family methyltransferase